jgi:hypothetical protein
MAFSERGSMKAMNEAEEERRFVENLRAGQPSILEVEFY